MKPAALLGAALAVAGCGAKNAQTTPPAPTRTAVQTAPATIKLSSPAFAGGGKIPKRYACPHNVSLPLRWSGVPSGTRELALEMIDIDATGGVFVHWALAGISPDVRGMASGDSVPAGARAGRNSFGKAGYGGPCPPPGNPHRYVLTLLALPERSGLKPGFSIAALQSLHARARGELMGLYGR